MDVLKVIPVLRCHDMKESLSFYTRVLGFEFVDASPSKDAPVYAILKSGDLVINLSTNSGDGVAGSVVFIAVRDIDKLFQFFVSRGLDTSEKEDSPVHQGPVDQTWGLREFYVTDPAGNTLRFGQQL